MYLRPSESTRPRILVIDEDPMIFDHVCGLLRSHGYRAIGADVAKTACTLLRRERVALVLADAGLPKAERAAWRAAFDEFDRAVPVVALCAQAQLLSLELFDAANELAAAAILPKPFSAAVLLQTVSVLLPRARRAAPTAEPLAASFEWCALETETTRH